MKLLLSIVKSFVNEYIIKVNLDKSNLLVFGKSYTNNLNITFIDCNVSTLLHTDHPGHVVGPVTGHENIDRMCNDFVMKVKFYIITFYRCSYDIKYRLVTSYPMTFYDNMQLDLTSKNINKLHVIDKYVY